VLKYAPKKDHFLRSCSIVKTSPNQLYWHSFTAGWQYLQNKKKLDHSRTFMRGLTALSKSANFGGKRL
jgi:hypothetical protein